MGRTEWGPSTLFCWCDTIDRHPHDWREKNSAHSLAFEPDAPFPDGEFAPCPVKGCTGQVRLKPAKTEAPAPKKARKKRTTKKKAT